jgi:hypothetical protein
VKETKGFVIGIQTEQFFDEAKNKLWGLKDAKKYNENINFAMNSCNLFLDLNVSNKPYYEEVIKCNRYLHKIHFGPYVFPSKKIDMTAYSLEYGVFIGGMSKRRYGVIKNLQKILKIEVVSDLHYKELDNEAIKYKFIINTHFQDGIYTEVPRLLLAYVLGKPVISESLSSEFNSNEHYINIDNAFKINLNGDLVSRIYHNFSEYVTENYSINLFLEKKIPENYLKK